MALYIRERGNQFRLHTTMEGHDEDELRMRLMSIEIPGYKGLYLFADMDEFHFPPDTVEYPPRIA